MGADDHGHTAVYDKEMGDVLKRKTGEIQRVFILLFIMVGSSSSDILDNGLQYIIRPQGVVSVRGGAFANEKQSGRPVIIERKETESGCAAVLIQYDLSKIPLENTVHSGIWWSVTPHGEGSSPSLAVYAVENSRDVESVTWDTQPKKLERISVVTAPANRERMLVLPVTCYMQNHLGDETVSFLIEMRSAPGFSQSVSFSGEPLLKIAKLPTPRYDLEQLLHPVWSGSRIENETLLPTAYEGSPASGNLSHTPSEIISVKNYGLYTIYRPGTDYITDGRAIQIPPGSAIPFFSYEKLYHHNPNEKPGVLKTKEGGFLTFSEGTFLESRQMVVTYIHDEPWSGPVPLPAEQNLQRTFQKLRAGDPLKLVVYGDSISAGGSASGHCGRAPWMPRWADLVAEQLHQKYGSKIDYINASLGGTRSDWGVESVNGLVSFEKPDLVILGFGMNDGGGRPPVGANQFVENICAMMDSIRAKNPSVDFLLLMSQQPNSRWRDLAPMPDYLTQLKAIEGPGIAIADIWSIHEYLLTHKAYWDMSVNHVNHPNDFMVRIYAQTILARLGLGLPDTN